MKNSASTSGVGAVDRADMEGDPRGHPARRLCDQQRAAHPLIASVAVPILRPDDGRLVGSLAQTLMADQMEDATVRRCAAKLAEMAGGDCGEIRTGVGTLVKPE